MIGAVIFIAMLLVMGGVEKNPGPHEVFNFRYQYLLIDVGTKVVRKVFDDIVGPDLYTFLTNHHAHLQLLIRRKMITCDQENLLPPIEPSPSSENFDISLLCCLLRNICGLCPPGDNVWIQPASTDKSIEANLTRIRLCRNSVAHSKSVLEEQTQLDTKWTDLSDSLKELGKKCSFTDLSKLIEKAETIEIDEHLKKKFDSVLELWNEMEKMFDRGLGEITKEIAAISECQRQLVKSQEELVKGQENTRKLIMETNQSTSAGLKKIQDELGNAEFTPIRRRLNKVSRIEDIRLKLIEIYQQEFGNIQLCPSVDFESGKILDFYQLPTMHIVDYHKVDKHQTEQSHVNLAQVETCNDLFCNGDKQCKNIYLTGEAGHGKTSFSRFMTFLWCNSKLAKQLENDKLQPYADYLARFNFLFYVNLRDTDDANVISMIEKMLYPYLSDDQRSSLYEVIEQILKNDDSLVIMDGLDEWIPKLVDNRKFNLPIKPESHKCVYFTTCRPYRIENVRLSRADIDHQVQIIGFDKTAADAYVAALIRYINANYNENKTSNDFMKAVKCVGINNLLHIPIITSHLVMLWIDRPLISMSRSLIYGNIIDTLFKRASKKGVVLPLQTSSNLNLPGVLSELNYLKTNFSHVEKLCLLSYRMLFELDMNITNHVFTREQLASIPYCLSESETNFLCRIGILSKCQVFRQYGRLELKLSFLHKSYLEFFAAIFVSTLETSKVLTLFNTCKTVNDALKFKNFLIFYAGLKTKNMNSLICRIYTLMSDHLISHRNQSIVGRLSFYSLISEYMIMIRTCYVEGSCGMESPILLEDFMFADPLKFHFNADYTFESEYNTKLLRKLLCLNEKNVKYLVSSSNKYFNEFDKITNLQWLKILHSTDYDVKFNELMLRNKSSLHSVCVDGAFRSHICGTEIPLNSLPHLTSVSLGYLAVPHQSLQSAVKFLSNNTHLQNVALLDVKCYEHKDDTDKCALTCDFSGCNHLESLRLKDTNIICSKINVSSLKDINLTLKSQTIANYYSDIFHCIQIASKLTSLEVHGCKKLNVHTVKRLINSIQCLPTIRRIWLTQMDIPDNVHLTLHPDNTQVDITLLQVMMSDNGFKSFVKSCTNKQSCIDVSMPICTIRQDDGDNSTIMSKEESFDFMYNYLTSVSAVTYIHKDSFYLRFITKDCQ